MSSAERPLQMDMFTGEMKDTRTRKQKQDELHRQCEQLPMFSSRDIAQFGVNPHPLLPIPDHMHFALERQDVRTDEEKARDLEREAQQRTVQLFPSEDQHDGVYLCPQSSTPITDPHRLLAATSGVPDPGTWQQEFGTAHTRLARQAEEHLLYLRLLYQ